MRGVRPLLLATLVVAGCGSAVVPPATDQLGSELYGASGRVVSVPGKPVRFCAPGFSADVGGPPPPPAYCALGVDVEGVDLDALERRREADGAVEGYASLTGTWDGTTLRVRSQRGPDPYASVDRVFRAPPCPEPDGGWTRRGENANLDVEPLREYGTAHPGQFVDLALARPSDTQVVAYLLTTGDVQEAEDALRPSYGKDLCVTRSRFSRAELDAARQDLQRLPRDSGVTGEGLRLGADGQLAEVADVVVLTPELQAVVARHPKGAIRVDAWLHPVTAEAAEPVPTSTPIPAVTAAATPSAAPVPTRPLYGATGRVVSVPGRPVRFCAPAPEAGVGYATPPPPAYCELGVDVEGVDLDRLAGRREDGGAVEGSAALQGIWDGTVLHVTDQQAPLPDPGAPVPYDSPPCPAPAGGWPQGPADANMDMQPMQEYAGRHPDEAVLVAMLRPSRTQVLAYYLTTGDVAEAERALRPLYQAKLCVATSRWTKKELQSAQADVFRPARGEQVYSAGATLDPATGQQVVHAEATVLTPGLQAVVDRHPKGILVIDAWLKPVDARP